MKKKKGNREKKASLSPEEKPLIENIIGMLNELLSMEGSENIMDEPDLEKEEDEEEVDKAEDEEEVEKAAEGENGDSPAQERLDETTPLTEESLKEVVKSLTKVLKPRRVAKSKNSEVGTALATMAKVLKSISDRQESQEKLNEHLFDALGFSEEIVKKTLSVEPVEKSKPIQGVDTAAFAKDIITEVFKNMPNQKNPAALHSFNDKVDVHKNINVIREALARK